MAWGSVTASTQLSLTGSYQIVQQGGGDFEVTLNPGEIAQVVFDYDVDNTTPGEDCDIIIQKTADGTLYESESEAMRIIISYANEDPAKKSITIAGVWGFQIQARLRDPDDTPGGDDTATLDVDVRKDGVSI